MDRAASGNSCFRRSPHAPMPRKGFAAQAAGHWRCSRRTRRGDRPTRPGADARAGWCSEVVFQRITDFRGPKEAPALSPDGKMAAFVALIGGRRQIWIRFLAGGAALQVTRDDVDHEQPRWAPDSTALIYYTPSRRAWRRDDLGNRRARRRAAADHVGDVRRRHQPRRTTRRRISARRRRRGPDGGRARRLSGTADRAAARRLHVFVAALVAR